MEKDKLLILALIVAVTITSFCAGFIISHYNEQDKAMFYQNRYVECQENLTRSVYGSTDSSDYYNIYIDSYDNQEENKNPGQSDAPD